MRQNAPTYVLVLRNSPGVIRDLYGNGDLLPDPLQALRIWDVDIKPATNIAELLACKVRRSDPNVRQRAQD